MKLKEDQFKKYKIKTLRVSGSESGLISVVPPCLGLVLFLWVIPVWGWSYFCGSFLCRAGLTSVGHSCVGWSYFCGSFLCGAGLSSVGHSCVGLVFLLWVIPVWGCLTSVGHSCVGLVLLLWVIPAKGWSYFCGSFLYGAGFFSVLLLSGAGHILVFNQYTRQGNCYTPCNHQPNGKNKKKIQYCQTDRWQQPLRHSIREKSVAWFSVCCRLYRPDCKGSLHCSMNCCRSVFGKPLSWYSWRWTRKYTHYTKIEKLILHPCGQSSFFVQFIVAFTTYKYGLDWI